MIENASPEKKQILNMLIKFHDRYTIRCALNGDKRVGKTSIAERYTNGKFSKITQET
jgi:GTPase SAR1 family protein